MDGSVTSQSHLQAFQLSESLPTGLLKKLEIFQPCPLAFAFSSNFLFFFVFSLSPESLSLLLSSLPLLLLEDFFFLSFFFLSLSFFFFSFFSFFFAFFASFFAFFMAFLSIFGPAAAAISAADLTGPSMAPSGSALAASHSARVLLFGFSPFFFISAMCSWSVQSILALGGAAAGGRHLGIEEAGPWRARPARKSAAGAALSTPALE
eukprot:CAMPEP_0180596314 /NCGR_PEP_ID=MMETSP1037_2-20121125/21745_1 /TAXON_ID=632150 /ORGANISM="Azadinium spinosum, Strain 3D9" /LENGTH=206 /DNA_ID=CAMNT_0022614807 /DNA_START=42 /DNA_END=660 /DNA_ORIENTATION=+